MRNPGYDAPPNRGLIRSTLLLTSGSPWNISNVPIIFNEAGTARGRKQGRREPLTAQRPTGARAFPWGALPRRQFGHPHRPAPPRLRLNRPQERSAAAPTVPSRQRAIPVAGAPSMSATTPIRSSAFTAFAIRRCTRT